MLCVYLNDDGTLTHTQEAVGQCAGYILTPANDYAQYFDVVQISAVDVSTAFTWGLGVCVAPSLIAYIGRVIIHSLNQIG